MADDDLHTRLTLLEKTAVSRELLVEREEKLLDRIEALMNRHNTRAEESLQHTLKVFGHDMADQLRSMRDRIHLERDEKLKAEVSELRKAQEETKPKGNDFMARWGLPVGVAALVGGPGTAMQLWNLGMRLAGH